jgi:hypothetical protein
MNKRDSLYALLPNQEPRRQRRGPDMSDRTMRRKVASFRKVLTDHVGGSPDEVERALIEQCCVLRIKCEMLEKRMKRGSDTEYDSKTYLAWANTFRRALAALNYGEVAGIIRQHAEAKLLKAYSR